MSVSQISLRLAWFSDPGFKKNLMYVSTIHYRGFGVKIGCGNVHVTPNVSRDSIVIGSICGKLYKIFLHPLML